MNLGRLQRPLKAYHQITGTRLTVGEIILETAVGRHSIPTPKKKEVQQAISQAQGGPAPSGQTQPTYHPSQNPYSPYPPYQPMPPAPPQKWYTSNAGIVALLVLFFPAGLFLMWRYAGWPKVAKWTVTGFLALLVIIDLASGGGAHSSQTDMASVNATSAPTKLALNHVTPQPTAKPTPTPKPTVAPTPTPIPQQIQPTQAPPAPSCNGTLVDGICYNFDATGGSVVTSPPADFCGSFSCITSFWSGTGYVVECADGMYSKSGGHSGSCSKHGGDMATLYQH